MRISTRRIRTISLQGNSCTVVDASFRLDYFRWERFLLMVVFRHFFVSAISEQERTIVLSFRADCLRGENCKSLLLNTVLLLSTDINPPFQFQR